MAEKQEAEQAKKSEIDDVVEKMLSIKYNKLRKFKTA